MAESGEEEFARDAVQLLRAAVPERLSEIDEIIALAGFREGRDGPGFKFENVYGQVIFTHRSVMQVYLISFLAWRALRAYSGLIILLLATREPFDLSKVAHLPEQAAADEAVDGLAKGLTEIRKAFATLDVPWPADIPAPSLVKHANVEDQAAQEVSLLALAFILLHEIHHVVLASKGEASGDWAEEHKCDEFARQMMLRDVDHYAVSCGDNPFMVRSKRAMAIALANAIYAEITPQKLWAGSDHPPIADRCFANYEDWPADPNAPPWIYMSSVLAAQLRRRNRDVNAIAFTSARDLCEKLTELTR